MKSFHLKYEFHANSDLIQIKKMILMNCLKDQVLQGARLNKTESLIIKKKNLRSCL